MSDQCRSCGRPIRQHQIPGTFTRLYCSYRCKMAAFYARHGGSAAYQRARRLGDRRAGVDVGGEPLVG